MTKKEKKAVYMKDYMRKRREKKRRLILDSIMEEIVAKKKVNRILLRKWLTKYGKVFAK